MPSAKIVMTNRKIFSERNLLKQISINHYLQNTYMNAYVRSDLYDFSKGRL